MTDSILTSIKEMLGPSAEYTHFDNQIISHINTALARLTLLGVGPSAGFRIKDSSAVWSDFISDETKNFEGVKDYVYQKVKLVFDPPLNSAVLSTMKENLQELEFCLNVTAENN